MSSSVFFKFKSQKEPTRVEFDGTGISVFELKRDIILKSGLGDGTDFDLAIYTEDGAEEYDDDTTIIPRSTTVVARRLPSIKQGAGRAARYVSGKMPVNAKNNSRKEQVAKAAAKTTSTALTQMSNALTEEERLAAMFQAQSEQWTAQQEELSHQTPVFHNNNKAGPGKRPVNVPDHDPPNGYICYRCGEKGHWIQLCPTNDNPDFDNRPRVKRTTGIPKSMLKTVDKATILGQNGLDDDAKVPSGVMVNADGEFVIALQDKAVWQKFQARTKSSAAAQKVAVQGDKELQDRGLECPMDKRLFNEPMKTPCCEKTYCNDCITNALIESDFVCPGCQSEGVLIDNLKPDDDTSVKIKEYLDEKEGKDKDQAKSPTAVAGSSPSANTNDNQAADSNAGAEESSKQSTSGGSKSPKSPGKKDVSKAVDGTVVTSNGDGTNPKKRPAEELAENPRVPRAPKAMQQQQEAQQQQQMMQQMMGGMNPMGMGMMPFAPMPMMNGMHAGMMGMPNMNMGNMGNMGMMNPMMNPMMGMGGFDNGPGGNMNGGGSMNGGGNMNGGYPMGGGYNNGGGGHMNMNGGYPMGGNHGNNGPGWGMPGQMNGNMGGHMNGHMNGGYNNHMAPFKQFSNQPATEDDAYFRKPVNPHRHQNRQRRVRPSDYREL